MNTAINSQKLFFLLFIICVVTRILSGVYYIEDIDSLRFALSLKEYNLSKLQPHFPGYPIFCFFAKIIFSITSSIGITFSLIGGVSIFIIIYYTLKLNRIELSTLNGLLCTILIFFNPLLWLMSNRYMPDLMGLSFLILSFYFLSIDRKKSKDVLIGFFLTGLLAGTRLSYLPLLLVPVCFHLIKHNHKLSLVYSFIFGCVIWLIPLVWINGIDNLYHAALKQTSGHFSDFGGTVLTENNWYVRIVSLIRSVWADGMGGYWSGRSWQTLILSLPMLYLLYEGIKTLKKFVKNHQFLIYVGSIIVYLIWILLFQNIIYKSRHILPLIVFVIIIINMGMGSLVYKNKFPTNLVIGFFFISLINVTLFLVIQHKTPNSISKIKDKLITDASNQTIVSIPLINYYLKTHGIESEFIDVEDSTDIEEIKQLDRDSLLLIGNFKENFLDNYETIQRRIYYHNPYVNRMWSEVEVARLIHKTNVK